MVKMGSFLFYIIIFLAIYLFFNSFKGGVNFGRQRTLGFEEAKFLVALLAKVAKGDGRVNELEARLISETLDDLTLKIQGSRDQRDELKRIYNIEKENISNAYELARNYRIALNLDAQISAARITFFLNLAYIDGSFSAAERKVIEDISDGLGLSRQMLNQIIMQFEIFYGARQRFSSGYGRQSYQGQSGANSGFEAKKDPYEVLGLPKTAKFSEVKKRYRELVRQYHPDILMGRGESEEVIEKSTKKLQEINEAYESIKERENA
ncbi:MULTISPECIES: DnaJ domain-containing protein [Campylobacter]|nr:MULTISPECIES: DnaJ domain-containing protein [Campylobacter]EJP74565.1 tellurite resistance protein TerB [Campylobacter sp. FOBRC14]